MLEKRRFRNLLLWASDFNENDPKTFKGASCTICIMIETK